ncbi:MAG: response regulator transcription factor [Actinobacteria bacterium]|nr:response regulator transcription factor [Actinomycetota bacterium]MCI0679437.1 response regulator transcription factor [Actinomycetota bacterium]
MPTVLVVDDDRSIRTVLERSLRLEGFDVVAVADGEQALDRTVSMEPDVVVLDVGLPGVDGVEVVRRLRADGNDVPICILSARVEIGDRVTGLEAGADDYMVKPFAVAELVARLNALLRRRPESEATVLVAGDLRVDTARRQVRRGQRDVELTKREFHLLETLMRNQGIVLTRERLLELVWGYDFEVNTNVVDVFVGYLRRKLERPDETRVIHTVRGVGFVLRP